MTSRLVDPDRDGHADSFADWSRCFGTSDLRFRFVTFLDRTSALLINGCYRQYYYSNYCLFSKLDLVTLILFVCLDIHFIKPCYMHIRYRPTCLQLLFVINWNKYCLYDDWIDYWAHLCFSPASTQCHVLYYISSHASYVGRLWCLKSTFSADHRFIIFSPLFHPSFSSANISLLA